MRKTILLLATTISAQDETLSNSIERGKLLYEDFCVRCHVPDGKGQKDIITPIAKSDFLFKHMEESIKALKFGGIDGEIIVNEVRKELKNFNSSVVYSNEKMEELLSTI